MEAAHHANIDMLQYLVRYDTLLNLDVNAFDDVGRNVLFYILEHDVVDCMQMLLEAGVMVSSNSISLDKTCSKNVVMM